MAKNDKGKALVTRDDQSSDKGWSKVVLNEEVFKEVFATFGDEVLATFGDEVITKYGSYKNIGKETIDDIIEWLWKKNLQRSVYGW